MLMVEGLLGGCWVMGGGVGRRVGGGAERMEGGRRRILFWVGWLVSAALGCLSDGSSTGEGFRCFLESLACSFNRTSRSLRFCLLSSTSLRGSFRKCSV